VGSYSQTPLPPGGFAAIQDPTGVGGGLPAPARAHTALERHRSTTSFPTGSIPSRRWRKCNSVGL